VLGTRQHGQLQLKLAQLPEDLALLSTARAVADDLLARDPELAAPEHALLRDATVAGFGSEFEAIPA
jgi:ATP-dependent DNA helicase RecG